MNAGGIGSICFGFLCGAGIAVGLVFLGKSYWPADMLDGSCQVTPGSGVTWECKGPKSGTFILSAANVTLEDGTTHICKTFQLSDGCRGIFHADAPTEVLNGEPRPCKWLGDVKHVSAWSGTEAVTGACQEPGVVGGQLSAAVVFWILAAALFCCCCCAGIVTASKDEDEDEDGDEDAVESGEQSELKKFVQ